MFRSLPRLPFLIAAGAGLCLAGGINRADGAAVPHSLEHAIASPSAAWQTGNALGHTLALDGTVLAVGSPFDDRGGADSGVVGIYDAGTGALLHALGNPVPSKESYFGWSVAVSGSRVVAGAPEDDSGENDTGIAYVYDLGAAVPDEPELVLENPHPGRDDTFGWSVAIDGDHVVVGVPEGDSGEMDAGCV